MLGTWLLETPRLVTRLQGTPIPADQVRRALERALKGVGPHADDPSRPAERILTWLREHVGAENLERIGQLLLMLLVLGAVAALVRYALSRAQTRAPLGRFEDAAGAPYDPSARARELAAAARAARADGDLRLALRLFLQAVLVALGGRGALELRPSWTNRELLRRGKPSPAVHALLAPLVRELEPQEFGRAPVGAADVQRLEALLAEHLERAS